MGPLQGIKVVELGFWVAGPACAAILADWGAEVVKVEPLNGGDPYRGMATTWKTYYDRDGNPPFELDNRGKRSIGLDYTTDEGKQVLLDLIAEADVFVTNLRVGALERAGLTYDDLRVLNPRLIYASITGLGLEGPDAHRAAYDVGSFWARSGVVAALTPEGRTLPYQRGGMGDHLTGLTLASGVSAALFHRTTSGEGQMVSTSLLRLGAYMMSWDLNLALRFGVPTIPTDRNAAGNPLLNGYTAGDGKRFWLLGLEGDRHWPNFIRAIDRPDLADDPRYAEIYARGANCAALIAELDAMFLTRTRAEWTDRFDEHGVWWAPIQAVHELPDDPQAIAAGCFVETPMPDGTTATMAATPVDFSDSNWAPSAPSPEFGQHTEEILFDLGYDWDKISALKDGGSIL
jgi:crotonobetainyl-CoA:carnitine CoA-transferase CaiB-like acyl-CoA transferase